MPAGGLPPGPSHLRICDEPPYLRMVHFLPRTRSSGGDDTLRRLSGQWSPRTMELEACGAPGSTPDRRGDTW